MARITVEDCVKQIPNRFELVLLASKRARDLSTGATALVEESDDKPTVVALREIAQGLIGKDFEVAAPAAPLEKATEEGDLDDALAAEFGALLEEGSEPKKAPTKEGDAADANKATDDS